jgi:DNA (cytosine-5)-methyltransferase 1
VVGTLSPGAHPGGANGQDAYTGHLIPATTNAFVKAKRAQSVDDDESWKEGGVSPRLNAFDNAGESRATVLQTFAFQPDDRHGGKGALRAVKAQVAPTVTVGDGHSDRGLRALAQSTTQTLGVRRLTPRECERLMGWPDDHTRYTADGLEIADSSRYRMCGNGVAAPVAKYVAECVEAIL